MFSDVILVAAVAIVVALVAFFVTRSLVRKSNRAELEDAREKARSLITEAETSP